LNLPAILESPTAPREPVIGEKYRAAKLARI